MVTPFVAPSECFTCRASYASDHIVATRTCAAISDNKAICDCTASVAVAGTAWMSRPIASRSAAMSFSPPALQNGIRNVINVH
eukprot:4760187-Prymnesium_polylepis.1